MKKNKYNTVEEVLLFREIKEINPNKLIYFYLTRLSPKLWLSVRIGEISNFNFKKDFFYSLKHPRKKVQRCTFNHYE